ncbi:DYM [Branchiostoma lanceolatum]|uniref:Dymeclin n=1 Tax=Branchiostoma lanceolatum TaxID=7740 RepID=A0A8J9ZDF4_BRALA|nr:DYM [Branchiostoma lanceolatum]
MGVGSSSMTELANNDYLLKLAGKEPISDNDPFWNQLLSFSLPTPLSTPEARQLEDATKPICKSLVENNPQTGNFCALIRVFLRRAGELKTSTQCENNVFVWQSYNALFIIRCLCKHFIEIMSEEKVLKHFTVTAAQKKAPGNSSESSAPLAETLIVSIIQLLLQIPVLNFTYLLHLEAINTLLVLLSVQMFVARAAYKSVLHDYLAEGKCAKAAPLLVRQLLYNFTTQEMCPASFDRAGGGSLLYGIASGVASGIWTILTLGIGGGGHPEDGIANTPALANQSMLLLLVLANHCGNDKDTRNPYREALISFVNIPETSTEAQIDASFNIKFASLYNAICGQLNNDSTILLLYILLHRNQHFKTFILSRLNIEALILPILQTLYHVADRSSHHIYMALIIILILSEDDAFSKSVHEIILKSVPWYTERALHKISLGGLLILVVIRTIQFNITRMRDKYLHTNCLAALANMSAHFHSLHQYVAQRIISLFELLCKKHSKFLELVTSPDPTVKHLQDYTQDLAILEEVIRMVLEIINSCLTSLLQHNPHLVYALLHKRHLFEQFRTHHTFQDIIQNIDTVITYFNSKMEQCPTRPSEPHEVLEVIEMGARQWPRDRLKKFPELRFKYVEEEQPEEFFIPYVWSLVFQKSRLHWDPNSIQLFVPDVQ